MKFRNYCIVALGETEGIMDIISKISETQPRKLEQRGVLICTFSSVMEPMELKDLLNKVRRTFFIFEVGSESSAYKIGRPDIEEQLFGYIERGGEEVINFMTTKLMNDINDTTQKVSGGTSSGSNDKLSEIKKMSKTQKQKEIDDLLDKGLDKLDEEEKKFLDLLTKNM